MSEPPTLTLYLPVPPSANALWSHPHGGNRGPRIRSDAYRGWLHEAGWVVRMQMAAAPPLIGEFDAALFVPLSSRRDRDNWSKPVFDLLQMFGVVRNDAGLRDYSVRGADRSDVLVMLWDRGGREQVQPNIRPVGPRPRRWNAADVARARAKGVLA